MNELELLTLNIDGKHNIPAIVEYLEATKPDVACLQEIYKEDLPAFGHIFKTFQYIPMTLKRGRSIGFALFATPYINCIPVLAEQYASARGELHELNDRTLQTRRVTERRALLVCDVEKRGISYRIGTTHFTWCKNSMPNRFQRQDLQALLTLIRNAGEIILCGDFNAPRGGEIFNTIAQTLKDNVPNGCVTTLDPTHIAGIRAVVDGIFTSPTYQTKNFCINYGLSDHASLRASIIKVL